MAGEVRAKGPSTPHTMSLINVLCTRPGGRYPRGGARGHSGPRGSETAFAERAPCSPLRDTQMAFFTQEFVYPVRL